MKGLLGLLLVWGTTAMAQGTTVNVGADRVFVPNGYEYLGQKPSTSAGSLPAAIKSGSLVPRHLRR